MSFFRFKLFKSIVNSLHLISLWLSSIVIISKVVVPLIGSPILVSSAFELWLQLTLKTLALNVHYPRSFTLDELIHNCFLAVNALWPTQKCH